MTKLKARAIHGMDPVRVREVWPDYEEWAMQLFREESPVQDICVLCGVVLDVHPTDEKAYRQRVKALFGPLPNPACIDCRKGKKL